MSKQTNEIAKLRKTLEQERIERKQHEALRRQPSKGDHTLTQAGLQEVQPQRRQQTLPRKSSMKDLTARSALEEYVNEPSINSTKAQAEHDRRHSETSILSIRSRRRGLGHENLTSAFIIPDITIRNVPEMTKEAQDILNGLANHTGHNCTVCKREMSNGENHDHPEMTKKAIKIPKPVPVSDRIREATEDEDEPTMRPSQPPGVALATVLKCLDDELAHLKIKLAKYEKIYNGHNPALDRRRRKSVHQHIQSTREEIEVKSDQIYALYDVLEGQKQASQEMSDEEAEMTMQSIGLDPSTLHLRGGGDEEQQTDKPAQHHPWDLESDAESNDGLPWEGIESTS